MEHSAGAMGFSSTYTGAANYDRCDTGLQSPEHCGGPATFQRHLTQECPKIQNQLQMSIAVLKLNTEEKVDGGKLSAGQRHCQDQLQYQSTGQGARGIEGFGKEIPSEVTSTSPC